MEESSSSENSKCQFCSSQSWVGGNVKKSKEHKGEHIFNIIQMATPYSFNFRICKIYFRLIISDWTFSVLRISKSLCSNSPLGRPKAHAHGFDQNKTRMNGPKAKQFMRNIHFEENFFFRFRF